MIVTMTDGQRLEAHARQGVMTRDEAADATERCREHLAQARMLLMEIKARQGWRALGYESWAAYVARELGISLSQAYRQITAGELELVIAPDGSLRRIPERHLRPLAALKDDPDAVRYAWETARHTAPQGRITAEWVEATVKTIVEARATHGHVDVYGEQSAIGAAITGEAYESAKRQRAALTGSKPPLLNERYESVTDAMLALAGLAGWPGAVRVVVYED